MMKYHKIYVGWELGKRSVSPKSDLEDVVRVELRERDYTSTQLVELIRELMDLREQVRQALG